MDRFNFADFKNPPKVNEVVYTWVWNDPVKKEGIVSWLNEFKNAGINAIYILPEPKNFRPYTMQTNLEPDYLSGEFFELVRFTFKKAKELGIHLWLYDEGGWPSGGACGQTQIDYPDAKPLCLRKRAVVLKKGEAYVHGKDTVASYINKNRVFEGLIAQDELNIQEYYLEKSVGSVNFVNLSDEKVTEAFINNTYEAYYKAVSEYFCKDKIFFTDEPGLDEYTLSDEIFRRFESEYGYSLKDYLYAFTEKTENEKEEKALIDYYRLMGRIFKENYLLKIKDWCAEHNISFGGHLDLDHIAYGAKHRGYFSALDCLKAFHVPGLDAIWQQIMMPKNGSVPVAEGERFYPRMVSSAYRQNGTKLGLSESLGVYGEGLSYDAIRYVMNFQAVRGINQFNFMMLSYGQDGYNLLTERPIFSPNKPGFNDLRNINSYLSRVSYINTVGEALIDNALYIPAADIAIGTEGVYDSYKETGEKLEGKGINFDIIDDYAVLEAEITENGLKIGNVTYKNVILPKCKYISDEVKEKIAPFVNEGKAYLDIENGNLRYSVRKTSDSEIIYFFFNEGENELLEDIKAKDEGKIYEIDLSAGKIYKRESISLKLLSGEAKAFIISQKEYECDKEKTEDIIEITEFEKVKATKFTVTDNGIIRSEASVEEIKINSDFSGELNIKAEFKLNKEDIKGENLRISLAGFKNTLSLTLNGKYITSFGINPMYADIGAEEFKEDNLLEITLANTMANEFAAKEEFLNNAPKEKIGPYNVREIVFEKEDKMNITMGTVKIAKYL